MKPVTITLFSMNSSVTDSTPIQARTNHTKLSTQSSVMTSLKEKRQTKLSRFSVTTSCEMAERLKPQIPSESILSPCMIVGIAGVFPSGLN